MPEQEPVSREREPNPPLASLRAEVGAVVQITRDGGGSSFTLSVKTLQRWLDWTDRAQGVKLFGEIDTDHKEQPNHV